MLLDKTWIQQRPKLLLSVLFLVWKCLLLCISMASPGVGYDTSTSLLLSRPPGQSDVAAGFTDVPSRMPNRLLNLEWAFGIGLSTLIATVRQVALGSGTEEQLEEHVVIGIYLSHVAHWLSVLLLWSITMRTVSSKAPGRSGISFTAAALHILSPAGIFLSAPYTESTFSLANMLGFYLYLRALDQPSSFVYASFWKLASGFVFGCGVIVRSNGILSGLPFFLDALSSTASLLQAPLEKFGEVRNLIITIMSGLLVAAGSVLPQYLAYQEYCSGNPQARSWCHSMPPSIFTWVQSHYWNVGFLHYWTLSNVPLFVLSAPMLYLLIRSAYEGCSMSGKALQRVLAPSGVMLRIALPQLVLAVLALTSYHVQIISRISSGYPFWYIWLAVHMRDSKVAVVAVRFMILYGLIQAGLYASFLPPA